MASCGRPRKLLFSPQARAPSRCASGFGVRVLQASVIRSATSVARASSFERRVVCVVVVCMACECRVSNGLSSTWILNCTHTSVLAVGVQDALSAAHVRCSSGHVCSIVCVSGRSRMLRDICFCGRGGRRLLWPLMSARRSADVWLGKAAFVAWSCRRERCLRRQMLEVSLTRRRALVR